jgi:type II secretory pathway component PulF
MIGTVQLWLSSFDLERMRAKSALSAGVRSRLYRKLAGMVDSGVPVPRAIDSVWRQIAQDGRTANKPLARAVAAWRQRVYDGRSVGEALTDWVPAREAMILEAGAADLPRAFEDAATLVDTERKVGAAVAGAVVYPVFLASLLSALLWIFSTQAIPAFAEVKPMEQWTGLAGALGNFSRFVHAWLFPVIAAVVAGSTAVIWSFPRWTGEWRARLDRFPPWSFYRLVAGTSFAASLSALLSAGVPLPEALRRLGETAGGWLAERIGATLYFVKSGHDLGESLHLTGYGFPSREMVDDLRIHASLGGVEEKLRRLVELWVKESLEMIGRMSDLFKMAGMALMAAAIAWVQLGIIAVQRQLSGGS